MSTNRTFTIIKPDAVADGFTGPIIQQIEKAGYKNIRTADSKSAPGADIHEMGGVRMGKDPKNSILNDILKETAHSGEWKNINKEAEVKSVVDDAQNLPDHLANAFTKDYSGVMKKVEEKEKFRNGA